jgi:hypothetical protein
LPIDRDPIIDSAAFRIVIGKLLAERFGGDGAFTGEEDG